MRRIRFIAPALFFLAPLVLAPPALAQTPEASEPLPEPVISVELNRLEQAGDACRGYFVVDNRSSDALGEVRLDVFLFDRGGIVQRRVGLTFLDIRPERTKVILFELPDIACEDIGRLLVNDVLACSAPGGAPLAGCGARVATSSRAAAEFVY